MKKYMILITSMFSVALFAQETQPKLEVANNKVKATYYFENGEVEQEGFFKDGKLEGIWNSYDEKGNKKAIGEYSNGKKTGKWFFWNDKKLIEVNYSDSRIATVKNWKEDSLVSKN